MPRTGDAFAIELALSNGAALMGTHAVDRMNFVAVMKKSNDSSVDDKLPANVFAQL